MSPRGLWSEEVLLLSSGHDAVENEGLHLSVEVKSIDLHPNPRTLILKREVRR